MKKVLVIPTWYPNKEKPLFGSYIREQVNLLKNDCEIRIYTSRLIKDISRTEKLKNTVLFQLFNKVIIRKNDGYFFSPPHVYGFEYSQGINKLAVLNYRLKIKAFLNYFEENILPVWKPDLIHAHDTFYAGIIAYNLYNKWGIPYIITEHNNFLLPLPDFIKPIFFEAIKNAFKLLLVSEYQKRTFLSIQEKSNVFVVGNFISEHAFTIPPKTHTSPFRILFIGRYEDRKNFSTLISIIINFSSLVKSKNYLFEIGGCGEDGKKVLMQEIKKYHLQDHCKFYPLISRKDIPLFFQNCDVVLNTSISETFGLASGEAMMCGKPVVSTDNGGFDEMYVPGLNGIKCTIGDAEGLAKALLSLYSREIEFDSIKIRESVLHKFGSKEFKSRMLKLYGILE